ncbi:TPA: hypothetical protein ACHR3F_004143 [Yersinia enterocolitica]
MGMTNHCSVRGRYVSIYQDAFDEVIEAYIDAGFFQRGQLKLTTIDEIAIHAWKNEWGGKTRKHRHGGWDWQRMASKRAKRCKKFDLAIWGDNVLCGLSLGLVTRGKKTVRLDYLEACPTSHPLESLITPIVIAVAIAVGQRVGAEYVAIFNPVNEAVEKHYGNLGFVKRRMYNRFLKNVMYKEIPK